MIKARRIRHVSFSTPDLARQTDYYQSIVGLGVVARESDRLFMATESDELAIVLEAGAEQKCKRIAFEVGPDVDLVDMRANLSASGIASEVRSDSVPGVSRSLVFTDPDVRQRRTSIGFHHCAVLVGKGRDADRGRRLDHRRCD